MEAEITHLSQLSGHEFVDWSGLKVKRLNKTTRGVVGPVNVFSKELDNKVIFKALIFLKQACDTVNNDELIMPEVYDSSDLPNPVPCPFPQVMLKSKDFTVEEKALCHQFPIHFYSP